MNANDLAPPTMGRDAKRILSRVGGFVAVLCHWDDDDATDAMESRMSAGRKRVRGNRGDLPVTIGDLRLIVASDLRILLEELEKVT